MTLMWPAKQGPEYDMFTYLSYMTAPDQPGFLINQLWSNMDFRNLFVTRYANLLNTTFRPERMAGIISQAADAIAPEIETHFRRWGRSYSQSQWQQAVDSALVQYTATRHARHVGSPEPEVRPRRHRQLNRPEQRLERRGWVSCSKWRPYPTDDGGRDQPRDLDGHIFPQPASRSSGGSRDWLCLRQMGGNYRDRANP